ncbi:MAG: hypothetical protein A2428_09135 [Bdellovibrionales bacterium RIFOXYC1_FULL_54_43]|nr:MAG: hypothetical protein A2428_09135 [Bdellovibrionales bacterium RIFOXYC1_FULL_54_43]OFZ82998.1 MAG: hypothetical protein A2603_02710 [Bdellovibrionales bacterium RIFOXYD1_FULL_55_31]
MGSLRALFRAHPNRFLLFSAIFCAILGIEIFYWPGLAGFAAIPKSLGLRDNPLTKDQLAQVLADSTSFYRFPGEIEIPDHKKPIQAVVQYSFDPKLQDEMENLFRTYHPDYGAFVAVDATTGRVLSMVSYSDNKKVSENLTLRATFPSASVFKVVTAAAAIEARKYSANTVIPFNGSNHTLYRNNILKTNYTRWTRYITLKDAFAKSVNTVFGKIGAYSVGPEELRQYAGRFGFNRRIAADIPIQEGRAIIPQDPRDFWGLAETASGYTRENTMSPLQGALIAAAIVNDGVMMEPFVVQSVYTTEGAQIYAAEPRIGTLTVDAKTAAEIRNLMRQTVTSGTSHTAFRRFFTHEFSSLNVGGKTGSLTGMDPPGKYDWFVGYADSGSQKIAIAALTIHEKFWRVKSSYLARRAIESYFEGRLNYASRMNTH